MANDWAFHAAIISRFKAKTFKGGRIFGGRYRKDMAKQAAHPP